MLNLVANFRVDRELPSAIFFPPPTFRLSGISLTILLFSDMYPDLFKPFDFFGSSETEEQIILYLL